MNNEQDSLSVTYERVRKVFGSMNSVAPQMMSGCNMLLNEAIKRNGDKPVPEIEIVGIYEMVTQHAWDSSFNVLSGNSSPSQTPNSTTSASHEQKSPRSASPAQKMPKQLHDLQNLPEDPMLGAVRANEAARSAKQSIESHRPVAQETDIFPDAMPKNARLIVRAEWTTTRVCTVVQSYYLSSNPKRSHWILWIRGWDGDSRKWSAPVEQCGIPRWGLRSAEAAYRLMAQIWNREMIAFDLARPDRWTAGRVIEAEELDYLVKCKWGFDVENREEA